MKWLLIPAVLAVTFLCGYLAACAGAQRWLGLREWWVGSSRMPAFRSKKESRNG